MDNFFLLLQILRDAIANFFTDKKVILVSERANWVIREESRNILRYLENNNKMNARISLTSAGARKKIIHFMSVNTFRGKNGIKRKKFFGGRVHCSNRIILTWFHINDSDIAGIKLIPDLNDAVDLVHTASNITKDKLIKHGLRSEKIRVAPLGVDLNIFRPISLNAKIHLREELNLPKDKIIIGSFQKDGCGWKDGLSPKLEKGPDIFCETVAKLSKIFPIHILLTGPARGYVKNRLKQFGISYSHKYLKKYEDIISYYQSLDLYLMCSREEGGPKAPLEAMATGIPVIATRVGMMPDIITNGINGIIIPLEKTDVIAQEAIKILSDESFRNNLVRNALITIKKFDLSHTEENIFRIYQELNF